MSSALAVFVSIRLYAVPILRFAYGIVIKGYQHGLTGTFWMIAANCIVRNLLFV